MKVYISGPMTGYVEHNFPAFHRAAEHLRSLGYEVVSPAELDDPSATHEELAKIPHWWFLRRDLRVLLDCDLIYLLPGWRWSKGATLEADVAAGTGIMRLTEHDDALWRTFEGEPAKTCGATQGPVPKLGGQIFTCVFDEGHDMPHGSADGTTWEPPAVLTIPEGFQPEDSILPCTIQTGTLSLTPDKIQGGVISRDYLHNYGNAIDEAVDKHHRKA